MPLFLQYSSAREKAAAEGPTNAEVDEEAAEDADEEAGMAVSSSASAQPTKVC